MLREEIEEMAALVPGTYYGAQNAPSTVDTNGAISGNKVGYFVTIPFTKSIRYSAGDVIRLAQDRNYSSLIGFRYINLRGSATINIVTNANMGDYAAFTYTVTQDGYLDAINFENSSAVQSATVKPLIYINNNLVLGG